MRRPEVASLSAQAIAGQITVTSFEGQLYYIRAADISAVADLPAVPRSTTYTGARAIVFWGSHSLIVRDTASNLQTSINATLAAALSSSYIQFEDQKASGTHGGTFTTGAWRTRDLNTEVSDTDNLASLSSNQVTIQPGTWVLMARAPAHNVSLHKLRLENISDATTIGIGQNAYATGGGTTHSFVSAKATFTTAKIVEVQHRSSATNATIGFGFAATFGVVEVYTQFWAWRIGEA